MTVHRFCTVFFISVVLINGLSPYLGIKWEYSMTMFSNLKFDCSNHVFMPSLDGFNLHQYYYVRELNFDEQASPDTVLFRKLLDRIGHLENLNITKAKMTTFTSPPISRNMLCYQIAKLKKSNSIFSISFLSENELRNGQSANSVVLTEHNCPKEWMEYDYFSRYAPIKNDYSAITELLRTQGEKQ